MSCHFVSSLFIYALLVCLDFSEEGKFDVGLAEVCRGAADGQTWRPRGELEPDRVPCANVLMLDRDNATLSRGMLKDSYVSGFSGLLCSFFSLIDLPKVVATQVQKKDEMSNS